MTTLGATRIASSYHQVKVGGDAAALKGIMKAVLESAKSSDNVLDGGFIETHTQGFEALAQNISQASWQDIESASGLKRDALERIAGRIREVERHHSHLRHGNHAARDRDQKRCSRSRICCFCAAT